MILKLVQGYYTDSQVYTCDLVIDSNADDSQVDTEYSSYHYYQVYSKYSWF